MPFDRLDLKHPNAELQLFTDILFAFDGAANRVLPSGVVFDPCFNGLVVLGQEIIFGFEVLFSDVRQDTHQMANFLLGDSVAADKAGADRQGFSFRSPLQPGKWGQSFRVHHPFAAQACQLLGRKFTAVCQLEIGDSQFLPSRPETNFEVNHMKKIN